MSPSDILTLIGKTNKISIGFFIITCVLLGYELYLYFKEKKGYKKPTIPLFKKGSKEPLSVHSPKPMPVPPAPQTASHAKPASPIPPLITQMSPPTMKHAPGAKKKRKMSRGAKVTVGATLALMVLTVGIAWRLNQPSSQQASNTTSARADEQLTPGAGIPAESSGSALTMPTLIPTITPSTGRSLIPTITPRSDLLDLSKQGSTDEFEPIATPTSALSNESASGSATTTSTNSQNSSPSSISQLPMTGGTASVEATAVPTLPIAGTIQYSIGLLVIASVIVIASLIF